MRVLSVVQQKTPVDYIHMHDEHAFLKTEIFRKYCFRISQSEMLALVLLATLSQQTICKSAPVNEQHFNKL